MPVGKISKNYTSQELTDALAKLEEFRTLLAVILGSVTTADKKRIAKLRNKTIDARSMMTIIDHIVANRPDLLPGTVTVAEFSKDRALLEQAEMLILQIDNILSSVRDTRTMAHSDLADAVSDIRKNIQLHAKRGDSDAENYETQLKPYFAVKRKQTPPTP